MQEQYSGQAIKLTAVFRTECRGERTFQANDKGVTVVNSGAYDSVANRRRDRTLSNSEMT